MSALPVLESNGARRIAKRRWAIPIHVCRVCLFVAVLILIRQKHIAFRTARSDSERLNQIELSELELSLPESARMLPWDPNKQSRCIVDENNQPISTAIQTSPASDSVIGYLGPTNLVVVLNPEQKIVDVKILESEDTKEHVGAIENKRSFLDQYEGLSWSRPEHWPEIDAVSGATLTSYAIMQSMSKRAGLEPSGLKFPNGITESEIRSCLGNQLGADWVAESKLKSDQLLQISTDSGANKRPIGYLVRTSPSADSLLGYQGPTDSLMILDRQMQFVDIQIRSSFDNEPYVRYVKEDHYMSEILAGKTLQEIASVSDNVYEGVSGATMTSLNVWDSVRLTAAEVADSLEQVHRGKRHLAWGGFAIGWRDIATAAVCLVAITMGLSKLRTHKRMRFYFLIVVVVYLGFISGDMLSQALLVGWTQHGLPISVAPGLVLLCLSALLVPMFSKHNIYCNHTCPMGAIQQLSKNRIGRKVRLPRRGTKLLKLIPGILLIPVILTAYKHVELNLASLEAFDAFSFRIAGSITIAVALLGLLASLFIPMAYCRFGCPTGAVLNYVRLNSRSGKIRFGDWVAIAAIVLGLVELLG